MSTLQQKVRSVVQGAKPGHYAFYPEDFGLKKFSQSDLTKGEQEVVGYPDVSNIDVNQSDPTIFEFTIFDSVCDAVEPTLEDAINQSFRGLIPKFIYPEGFSLFKREYPEVSSDNESEFTADTVIVSLLANFDTALLEQVVEQAGYHWDGYTTVDSETGEYFVFLHKINTVSDSMHTNSSSVVNYLSSIDPNIKVYTNYFDLLKDYGDFAEMYRETLDENPDGVVVLPKKEFNTQEVMRVASKYGYQLYPTFFGRQQVFLFLPTDGNSNISDSSINSSVQRAVDAEDIYNLYAYGKIKLVIPKGTEDKDAFAQAVISWIKDIWGDPEVGIKYEDADFEYSMLGDQLYIEIVK